jgi:ATP-binding cassette subfamily B protein
VETVAHHERPEYLDRLSMLRNQVFVLDHMYMSLFSTLGWILRLGVTMALLASIHPALLLLAVFAIPTVLTSGWRPAVERAAQERGAQSGRLARHLFTLATTAAPGKEVRVTGIGERLVHDRRAAWDRWYGPVAAVRWVSAWWLALGWAIFGLAYVGAVVFVSSYLRAPASSVLLVLAAGARLSGYILDGWLEASGLARRLRCFRGRQGRSAGSADAATRHPPRACFFHLSRDLTGGARRCVADVACGCGGGDRGRERRRQDHAG